VIRFPNLRTCTLTLPQKYDSVLVSILDSFWLKSRRYRPLKHTLTSPRYIDHVALVRRLCFLSLYVYIYIHIYAHTWRYHSERYTPRIEFFLCHTFSLLISLEIALKCHEKKLNGYLYKFSVNFLLPLALATLKMPRRVATRRSARASFAPSCYRWFHTVNLPEARGRRTVRVTRARGRSNVRVTCHRTLVRL
jgi:hypothetical protein